MSYIHFGKLSNSITNKMLKPSLQPSREERMAMQLDQGNRPATALGEVTQYVEQLTSSLQRSADNPETRILHTYQARTLLGILRDSQFDIQENAQLGKAVHRLIQVC